MKQIDNPVELRSDDLSEIQFSEESKFFEKESSHKIILTCRNSEKKSAAMLRDIRGKLNSNELPLTLTIDGVNESIIMCFLLKDFYDLKIETKKFAISSFAKAVEDFSISFEENDKYSLTIDLSSCQFVIL